jgi:hypothetical protein
MLRMSFCFVALALAAAPAAADKALSVDAVVARHLEAQGGAARLKALSSVSYTATDTFDGKTTQIVGTRARPNLFRFEHGTEVKAFDGNAGWYTKDGKVEMMTEEKVAKMRGKSTFDDVLVNPAAHGAKIELAGTKEVNGAPAHVLLVTMDNGDTQKRFIDAKSFLEVQRVSEWTYEGKRSSKVVTYKDHKQVAGITTAMSAEYEKDGKRGTYTMTRVQYDGPVAASLFAPPAAAAVPAATKAAAK